VPTEYQGIDYAQVKILFLFSHAVNKLLYDRMGKQKKNT